MFNTILEKEKTNLSSANIWSGVPIEQTGGFDIFTMEGKENSTREKIDHSQSMKQDNFKREYQFIKSKSDINIINLRGRVENIESDIIIVGFEIPEECRREYYPIEANQINFDIKVNEIIDMEIIKNKLNSQVIINFYPYKESKFFKNREEDLKNKLINFNDIPEDDF